MTNTVDDFLEKKRAESQFLSLEDAESVRVLRLTDVKCVTKAGYGGEEKSVLRLKCLVDTSEGQRIKDFDNGTARFAKEMQEKGIVIGSKFTITREGTMTKTKYHISEVVNEGSTSTHPANRPVEAPLSTPVSAPVVPTEPSTESAETAPVAP